MIEGLECIPAWTTPSLCVEWLWVNVAGGRLTVGNLVQCAVVLYEELTRGHSVIKVGGGHHEE